MKKAAIILSGSGVYDGSELHETVLTLLALEKLSINYQTFAPDIAQRHVVDHSNGEATNENRNVFVESNRLTRGNTKKLSDLNEEDFDSLIFVGGFGAAKNLSDFALTGEGYNVIPEIEKVINAFHQSQKWILAMCIAPVLLVKTITDSEITIGNDQEVANALPTQNHINCDVSEYHIDEKNRLITTPAYMCANNLLELELGINTSLEVLNSKLING